MTVDDVTRLVESVRALRPQVEEIGGQLLPVETQVRDSSEPLEHAPPGLPLKIKPHSSVFVGADFQLFRIWRRFWRCRPRSRLRSFGLGGFTRLRCGISRIDRLTVRAGLRCFRITRGGARWLPARR